MKRSLVSSIGVIILAGLAFGWAELYLPLRESFRVDLLRLAGGLSAARAGIAGAQAALPRLADGAERLAAAVAELGDQLASAFSDDLYVAVNTGANRLYLRRGREVLREARISTGTGDTLRHGRGKWVFDTPRGAMTVWRKKEKPVWVKPDWAFLEEGKPIPPMDSPERRQEGVLGEYFIDLGGGIGIHGTPHENLLGRSVTHGCIRVGRDDLRVLYDSVPVGARVYIY
ncbi:MAG: L,D-transpeptidase [bacterium]